MKPIIDISQWQEPKYINYDLLAQEISGAMIRAGFTGYGDGTSCYIDPHANTHYTEFNKRGVPCGFYWYSCAVTEAQGEKEARQLLSFVQGKNVLLPLAIDVEDNYHQAKVYRTELTNAVIAFCKTIEQGGRYASIYSSTSWFQSRLDDSRLQKYDHWLAHWTFRPNEDPPYKGASVGLWQYSDKGRLNGYNGDLDLNKMIKDYPALIKKMNEKKAEPSNDFNSDWWKSSYSIFHKNKVMFSCLIDPSKVQTGGLSEITKHYKAGTFSTIKFPEPYIGHIGVDSCGVHRSNIYAGANGSVIEVGHNHAFNGNFVQVKSGNYRILYCHLDEVTVKQGQEVNKDTQVGYQGTTGNSTGSHLHISIWKDGYLIDPLDYILGAKTFDESSENAQNKPLTLDYANGVYKSLTDINLRSKPIKNGNGGDIKGIIKQGSLFTVINQVKDDGFDGAWVQLDNNLWLCAQDKGDIYIQSAKLENTSDEVWHTVELGDTPWALGIKYGVDYKQIERLNNLVQPYSITVGQKLRIK